MEERKEIGEGREGKEWKKRQNTSFLLQFRTLKEQTRKQRDKKGKKRKERKQNNKRKNFNAFFRSFERLKKREESSTDSSPQKETVSPISALFSYCQKSTINIKEVEDILKAQKLRAEQRIKGFGFLQSLLKLTGERTEEQKMRKQKPKKKNKKQKKKQSRRRQWTNYFFS